MLFFSETVQIFLPSLIYVVFALLGSALYAFLRKPRGLLHRWRFPLAGLFVWAYASSAPVFSNLLMATLEDNYHRPAAVSSAKAADTVILVLASGRVRRTSEGAGAHPDEAGWSRAMAAIELWKSIGGKLVFNGGPMTSSGYAVADRMAELARRQGVPDADIVVDRRAKNTYENMQYALEYTKGVNREVWLVTSALHMTRAMNIAKKLSITAIPYPCDFRANTSLGWRGWFPHNNGPKDLESVMHELMGMLIYRVRGWL
jgi:uncharacterized SAM-binding protein YcdF (DUF218 family)